MRSPLTRTAFVLSFCCNDSAPDCNLPTEEVSQSNYSGDLCLLFSDYSPKLEDTYYSQIIPGIICQSLFLSNSITISKRHSVATNVHIYADALIYIAKRLVVVVVGSVQVVKPHSRFSRFALLYAVLKLCARLN